MKVDISNIVRVNGASLQLEFVENPVDGRELTKDYIIGSPVSFEGIITNMSGILELDGQLKTSYKTVCYRCLKEIDRQIDIKIQECFINEKQKADEMDAYCYEGKLLDLDKALEDNIILNLPMKQLCTGECKGLCQMCGINLNEKSCNCIENSTNPQMEALDKFFSK